MAKAARANSLPPMHEVSNQQLFKDPDPEPQLDDLKRNWPAVWSDLRAWLEPLPEGDLSEQLCSQLSNGSALYVSRWQIVLHLVNHSTLHRGQAMSMLRTLGKQPPGTDLFGYYLKYSRPDCVPVSLSFARVSELQLRHQEICNTGI